MRTICLLLFMTASVFCSFANVRIDGGFVQKKYLRDVGVTLTSVGKWSFEKDRKFVWNTLKPVPSLFVATPTNYSFSAGGRTTSRRIDMKIENFKQVFEMQEMKGIVESVESDGKKPMFKADGLVIPSMIRVLFKNGDSLEITLKKQSVISQCSKN